MGSQPKNGQFWKKSLTLKRVERAGKDLSIYGSRHQRERSRKKSRKIIRDNLNAEKIKSKLHTPKKRFGRNQQNDTYVHKSKALEKGNKDTIVLSRSSSCFDFYESLNSNKALMNSKISLQPLQFESQEPTVRLENEGEIESLKGSKRILSWERDENYKTIPTPNFNSYKKSASKKSPVKKLSKFSRKLKLK